jgi:cytochrome c peroxidase
MRIVPIALLIAGTLLAGEPGGYDWNLPRGFPKPRVPAGNPMSEVKARLGRYLFYDQRLSVNGKQSCATCHRQELAFTDGRATGIGATGQIHPRSAMSLVNVAYSAALTWSDPTLRSLEEQARIPMFSEHPVELGLRGHEHAVLAALRADPIYRELFPRAFPRPHGGARRESRQESMDAFTIANVARALATFERTIVSARSPYDRFHTGGEEDAISESAKRGETVFFSDPVAGCFRCHGGFNFSDAMSVEGGGGGAVKFHNTALYEVYGWPNRGIFEHTRKPADAGKFKAPSLRNIALTAPYMHDGSIRTLEEALDHYAAGGRGHANPNRDPLIRKIELTPQNRVDLLAFLRSLTDEEVLRDPRFSNPWERPSP